MNKLKYVLLYVVTLAAYWPCLNGGFLWDDDGHVTKPALQSLHGLWRIWFEVGATQQYYPVLHSAFWLEHRLWGEWTFGYHLLNVLLHATSACLFGAVLRRLLAGRADFRPALASWIAAFLFALHPVCVESVAWISEQKNTLSAVFYLLAGLTYLRWRERPATSLYILATLLFILAILSKSVTATLPAALLVVLWWRNGTLSFRRDVAPLIPWFAVGIAGGFFTAWVERSVIGAQGSGFALGIVERCLLAGRIVWFYLGKLVWPGNLIFIYPRWHVDSGVWWQWLYPLALVALLAALWMLRARWRGPLAALLFFVGTLFPALGFFNVYPFVFSYVADHFQYLASLGVFAFVGCGLARLCSRKTIAGTGMAPAGSRAGMQALSVSLVPFLGFLSFRQGGNYRDAKGLYAATIQGNPASWMAHYNLGMTLLKDGQVEEAVGHFEDAIRAKPDYVEARSNLGSVFARTGRYREAIAQFEEGLKYRPNDPRLHYNLANALADMGHAQGDRDTLRQAAAQYQTTLRLDPSHAGARNHLAQVLRVLGD